MPAKIRLTKTFSKSWAQRELEATRESLRAAEQANFWLRVEIKKLRREVAAHRVVTAVNRVRSDSRVTTTTSMDEEMTNLVQAIVEDREIQLEPYMQAREVWLALTNEATNAP